MPPERRTTRLAALTTAIAVGGGLALLAPRRRRPRRSIPTEIAYVGAADIRPDESTYVGWHNGAATGSFVDGNGQLDLTGKVQILNGFDAAADNGDLRELIDAGISWGSTNAYFQIPLFFDDAAGDQQFTTLRPAATTTDVVALDAQWTTSRAVSDAAPANTTATLEELLAAIEGASPAADDVDLLGYGFFVDEGQTGSVSWVKWGTLDTEFVPAPVEEPIGEPVFDDSEQLAAFLAEREITPVDGGTLTQGTAGQLQFQGDWYWDGLTFFDAYTYSAPVAVGVFQADSTGLITVTLSPETLAALAPGQHTLVLASQGQNEGGLYFVTFTVVAAATPGGSSTVTGAALAETGFDATLPLVGGALLLAAGVVLVLRRRAGASA